VNWDLCINQICSKAEYHLNNEENVYFDLTEVEEENTKYLLDPFIAEGQPNMLFGKGGTGKSYLSMAFAIAVTQGVPFLSYYPFEKRKVLFIDYESSKGIFAKRLKMVSAGYGEKGSLLYRHVHQPLSDIADSLREHVRKEGIGLIIVDSAALACGGRPEEAENALRFFNALRTIGCTSLVIAHETKSENKAYPFGSVFFFNSFRNIWNAQSEPDDIGSRALNLGLFHRKSNEDRLHKPKGVRIFFGDSQIDFSKGSTEYWEKELSNIERVEELLRGGAESTKKEISDELDIKSETVKKSLQRLQQSGKAIFDEKSKKWRFEDPLKLVD